MDVNKHWKTLNQMEYLDLIDIDSNDRPVIIMKHSTRCGTSTRAENLLSSGWKWAEDILHFYHLDLLAHRDISNEIALKYDVFHQSPQLILIRHGRAVDSVTHHAIDPQVIEEWLGKIMQ